MPDTTTAIAVTVIIPARNEQAHIAQTLTSILASQGVAGSVEIIVADGNSTDGTAEIVASVARNDARVRLVANPEGYAAHAFNLGIRAARGRHVMIMSAHATLSPDHLAHCVNALDEDRADIVGGVIDTVASGTSDEAIAVWCVMTSAFGFGPSRFRTGASQPLLVDTIVAGMMRRQVVDDIGYFDEELVRGQDDEFNARARTAHKRLLLLPHLRINYAARATIAQLFWMCFQYGAYKPVSNLKAGTLINLRQFAPLAMIALFASGVLAGAATPLALIIPGAILVGYAGLSVVAALRVSRPRPTFAAHAFVAFSGAHIGYGLGYLTGLIAVFRFGTAAARKLSISPALTTLTR